MFVFNALDQLTSIIAAKLNADIPAIRIILSILFGYPIAVFYSLFAASWTKFQRQLCLFIFGIFLCYWNFGVDILHLFIGIFTTIAINHIFRGSKLAVILTFMFNMIYLLVGSYIVNQSRNMYDINWTTPFCVLCLRLIGLSWDLFDASKPESDRSAQQKKSALEVFPGIFEVLSFCFVPTAFISGPQFTMRHYQSFVNGSLRPIAVLRNRSFAQRFLYNVKVKRTISRFTMGILGFFLLTKLLSIYPASKLLTTEFQQEWSFLSRFTFMMAFSHVVILRYVVVWLIGEGACVLLGLGCTGLVVVKAADNAPKPRLDPSKFSSLDMRTRSALDRRDSAIDAADVAERVRQLTESYDSTQIEIREADHTACASISIGNLILATNTDQMVAGFNINTNRWMLDYVYKRLRFLGSKKLSQFLTLLFLSVWHGTYSGYFVNFGLEYVTIIVEKDLLRIVKQSKYGPLLYTTWFGIVLTSIVGKLHAIFLLTTPLVAFYLLRFELWYPVLKSTYFVGFVYFLWPLARPLIKRIFKPVTPVTRSETVVNGILETSGSEIPTNEEKKRV